MMKRITTILFLLLAVTWPAYAVKPVYIFTRSVPAGQNGVAYTSTVKAKFGTKPYTWTVGSGALPDGLSLAGATGIISGTPTVNGTFNFVVHVVDSAGSPTSDDQSLFINVSASAPAPTPSVSITTGSLPTGIVGGAYSATLQATGGTAPYTWSRTAGSFPPAASLNTGTGAITGTLTDAGTYTVTVRVTDSSATPQTFDRAFAVTVDPAVSPTYLFSDDFESGCTTASCTGATGTLTKPYFPAWTLLNCGSGSNCPTVQNTVKHAGSYAYEQRYQICGDSTDPACGAASQDTNRWVGKVLSPAQSHFFTRGYLRLKTPTLASMTDDVVQRKLFRWSDSGNLPGTQYDFVMSSWTSTGGVVHPTYASVSFLSQTASCPWTGTVNTSGTAVSRVSGASFITNTSQANGSGPWAGSPITINGVVYTVASVTNANALVLTTSAGTQTGVAFTKPWVSWQAYDLLNLNYDTWYSIETEVQLNTPGVADGVLKIWKDGVLAVDKSTVIYRGYGCSNDVNFFGFGAQTNRYSYNSVDEYRYWDDIVINTSYIGP